LKLGGVIHSFRICSDVGSIIENIPPPLYKPSPKIQNLLWIGGNNKLRYFWEINEMGYLCGRKKRSKPAGGGRHDGVSKCKTDKCEICGFSKTLETIEKKHY